MRSFFRRKSAAVRQDRWVVVDVEATGLDAHHDRLLAIAAIGVRVDWTSRQLAIEPADSLEVLIRNDAPSTRENILVHGIGWRQQAVGEPVDAALRAFAEFSGGSPLLAFHVGFDRTLLERHARESGVDGPDAQWVDIEHLCAVARPEVAARSLDEWLVQFGVDCLLRHNAAADAFAEAELLLRVWPAIARECAEWADVVTLARGHRWLRRS